MSSGLGEAIDQGKCHGAVGEGGEAHPDDGDNLRGDADGALREIVSRDPRIVSPYPSRHRQAASLSAVACSELTLHQRQR
jgi:hypothetical protein